MKETALIEPRAGQGGRTALAGAMSLALALATFGSAAVADPRPAASSASVPARASATRPVHRGPSVCAGLRGGRAWQRTELYFGRNTPAGPVTDAQFQAFLDDVVTPRFPDGLTVLQARGQWRAPGASAPESEDSMLLVLVVPSGADSGARIEAIRRRYQAAFQQQAVLRVDSPACVSF